MPGGIASAGEHTWLSFPHVAFNAGAFRGSTPVLPTRTRIPPGSAGNCGGCASAGRAPSSSNSNKLILNFANAFLRHEKLIAFQVLRPDVTKLRGAKLVEQPL